MVNVRFPQGLLNIAVALAASYVVYWLSALIAGKTRVLKRVLAFFGEDSLIFFFWHACEINVLDWGHTIPADQADDDDRIRDRRKETGEG